MVYIYIYLIVAIIMVVCIRFISSFKRNVDENISGPNPAVVAVVLWPLALIALGGVNGYELTTRSINWAVGNGFVLKDKKEESGPIFHSDVPPGI
jgi:hypothetical protein